LSLYITIIVVICIIIYATGVNGNVKGRANTWVRPYNVNINGGGINTVVIGGKTGKIGEIGVFGRKKGV